MPLKGTVRHKSQSMLDDYKSGQTVKEISEKYQITEATMRHHLCAWRKKGILTCAAEKEHAENWMKRTEHHPLPFIEDATLCTCYEKGMSANEIVATKAGNHSQTRVLLVKKRLAYLGYDLSETYPKNLLKDLFGKERYYHVLCDYYNNSTEMDFGIDFVLTMLPEKNRCLIEDYYKSGNGLRQIGEKLGISKEATHQRLHRALSEMLCYDRWRFIRYGLRTAKEYISNYQNNNHMGEDLLWQYIQLSDKAKKCVQRSGVHTIEEFLSLTEDWLIKTNYPGSVAITEILKEKDRLSYSCK